MNLDPIPNAVVVDFFAAYSPDRLHRHPPMLQGFYVLANFETLPAPDFGQRAVFPDRLFRLYPEHAFAFVPPPTVQTVAPTFFAWYGPDRLYRLYPQHPAFHEPPHFETLPAPDYSWRAYFQDRLERIRALWPYPQPVMNIEPIVAPAPDFGNRAFFPDRLELIRALWPYPQPVMNLDPIANPVPDFIQAIMPDRLYGFKPAPFPFRFYTPTPSNFLVLEDYSRGLNVGDVRGLYHTPYIAVSEPYAVADAGISQVIPNNAVTTLTLAEASFSDITSPFDADNWRMIDAANDRIVVKHPGWYLATAFVEFVPGAASTNRRLLIRAFRDNGSAIEVPGDMRFGSATTVASMTPVSYLVPMRAGWYFTLSAEQASGGDLALDTTGKLTVVRLARPTPILPLS
jgi:hypothetical protein